MGAAGPTQGVTCLVKQLPGRTLVPTSGVTQALPRCGVYCAVMVRGFIRKSGPLPKRGCKITEQL